MQTDNSYLKQPLQNDGLFNFQKASESNDLHKNNGSINVQLITTEDEFLALRSQWNALNDHSEKSQFFVSWEWLFTWWQTYKSDSIRQLYILCCYENNILIGIAPFQIVNNPRHYFPCSRQLVMLGTGETDGSYVFGEYMDLIIKPYNESLVLEAFSDYLIQNKALWDGAKFHELLHNSHLSKLFQRNAKVIEKKVSSNGFRTFIELPESYKDYLMSLRKKMRNNITRTFKRLNNEQEFTIDRITDVAEIDEAIEIIADLNRSRRKNLEKDSVFAQKNFVEFHKLVCQRLLPLNKVIICIIRFKGEPVAALYSYIDGDTVHAYQSGFEEKNGHRYSLLTTMLTHEIEESIKNKDITRFNFMYSDEEATYKKRYSGTTEKMYKLSYDKCGFKFSLYKIIHGPIKNTVKKILKIA
jgi:CelD/BcsL family acetyltransferase involved in cellulose biosynthesis